jgi:uncharacterized protein (UPF0548 family)
MAEAVERVFGDVFMLCLRRPTAAAVRACLAAQAGQACTFPPAGASAPPPPGYVVDHARVRLGTGERAFVAARQALERWEQFRLGWVEAVPDDTPIRVGEVVAILAASLGLWWLNACRIVAVVDEDGSVRRFGFEYSTLRDHAASGQERFLVEWDRDEGGVWYDIFAVSRPRGVLARLGYPWLRRVQKRFRRDSAAAMRRAVAAGLERQGPGGG